MNVIIQTEVKNNSFIRIKIEQIKILGGENESKKKTFCIKLGNRSTTFYSQ